MAPEVYSPSLTTFVALLAATFLLYRVFEWQRDSLSHIPYLDKHEKYIQESEPLVHSGYQKYTSKGSPFRIRNPVNPGRAHLILPFKYLDEVKNAPQNRLSFPLYSKQAFLLGYIKAPQQTDSAAHIVRSDLNKQLPSLVGSMQDECEFALSAQLPECKDWTPVQPYTPLAQTTARILARILCGQELARDNEWINICIETTIVAMHAADEVRKKFPPYLRWLAPYILATPTLALESRKRAAEILTPIYKKRVAGNGDGVGKTDGIKWFIKAAGAREKTPQELADELLFLSIASVHSSCSYALSILHDLLNHRKYYDDILEEVREVRNQHGVKWTRQSLSKLEKLDSFMKESQRVHPVGLFTVQRSAVKSYTFKDGFRIPANTHISFPMAEQNRDPSIWPNAEEFDGYRFLRLRQQGQPNAWQFASVGETSIGFGAGAHACPGRYFATFKLKLVLTHLLLNYEMKWSEIKGTHPNEGPNLAARPNATANIMFRRTRE